MVEDMSCPNCGFFKCQCAARALDMEAAKKEAKPPQVRKELRRVRRAKNFDDGAPNE